MDLIPLKNLTDICLKSKNCFFLDYYINQQNQEIIMKTIIFKSQKSILYNKVIDILNYNNIKYFIIPVKRIINNRYVQMKKTNYELHITLDV